MPAMGREHRGVLPYTSFASWMFSREHRGVPPYMTDETGAQWAGTGARPYMRGR
jgi:hypothetical protein